MLEHQLTSDGSSTLYSEQFNASYHSVHGAIQESKHVFIHMGWEALPADTGPVHILEMGLGTGLNAVLTSLKNSQRQVYYTALEAYPIQEAAISTLNYGVRLDAASQFQQLHDAPWNVEVILQPHFHLTKHHTRLEKFALPVDTYHLVYYDAFAPVSQPELWQQEVFERLFNSMTESGILVTYCAKGAVRRAMMAAGFTVERVAGPPGKREMLRARKITKG